MPRAKKTLKLHGFGVFAIPGLLLTHFELRNPGLKKQRDGQGKGKPV